MSVVCVHQSLLFIESFCTMKSFRSKYRYLNRRYFLKTLQKKNDVWILHNSQPVIKPEKSYDFAKLRVPWYCRRNWKHYHGTRICTDTILSSGTEHHHLYNIYFTNSSFTVTSSSASTCWFRHFVLWSPYPDRVIVWYWD